MQSVWKAITHPETIVTKAGIFIAVLVILTIVPMLANPIDTHAVTDCTPNGIALSGSSWLGGNGINGASTLSGGKWECVELVNRLCVFE